MTITSDAATIYRDFATDGVPSSGVHKPVKADVRGLFADIDAALGEPHTDEPFGRAGLRILVGEQDDAHYGFGGIVAFDSGKWVHVYRKAADHGTTNNAELRARDSTDQGATWTNDRLLLQDADADSRPSPVKHMASGRIGFWVNRASETTNKFPLFAYSDDKGVNFTFTEISTASITYTFADHTGILPLPASQGGDDTNGFFSIGFTDAGGIDMFKTTNNGTAWTIVSNVGVASGIITQVSESWVEPIADDKYFIFSRAQDGSGWRENLTVWATTDITDWGTPIDGGIPIGGGNPPGSLFDSATSKIHMLQVARGTRDVDDFEHHLMTLEVDADTLWTAGGDFGSLGLEYRPLTPVPHWATGYIDPFQDGDSWYTPFTCGEPGTSGGDRAVIAMIGDFTPTGAETMQYVEYLTRHLRDVRTVDVRAADNEIDSYPVTIRNRSKTATVSYGAYGMSRTSGGSDYEIDFDVPLTILATDNATSTRPLVLSNSSKTASLELGAYTINSVGATSLTFTFGGSGPTKIDAGGIVVPDGSAAAPSVAGTTDETTGVFFTGTSVRIGTAGVQRFAFIGNSLRATDAGTAAAPVYSWTSDPDSGFYSISADVVGVTIGGSEVMRWDAARLQSLLPVNLPSYTVATVPTGAAQDVIYVSDGDAGSPCLAVYDGTDWLRVPLGAAISAT